MRFNRFDSCHRICFVVLLFVFCCKPPICGAIFTWTDESGVTHYSDVAPAKKKFAIETPYPAQEKTSESLSKKPPSSISPSDHQEAPAVEQRPVVKSSLTSGSPAKSAVASEKPQSLPYAGSPAKVNGARRDLLVALNETEKQPNRTSNLDEDEPPGGAPRGGFAPSTNTEVPKETSQEDIKKYVATGVIVVGFLLVGWFSLRRCPKCRSLKWALVGRRELDRFIGDKQIDIKNVKGEKVDEKHVSVTYVKEELTYKCLQCGELYSELEKRELA